MAVIAVALLGGAGWWAWKATRPADAVAPDGPTGSPVAPVIGSPAKGSPVVRAIPVQPRAPLVPSLHVSADEVLRVDRDDPQLAAATYKGRVIAVDGRVETVGPGLFGTPCIGLGGSNGASSNGRRVQCAFGQDDAATLNAVRAGDTITVVGNYDGVNGNDVQLTGCVVSANPANAPATQP